MSGRRARPGDSRTSPFCGPGTRVGRYLQLQWERPVAGTIRRIADQQSAGGTLYDSAVESGEGFGGVRPNDELWVLDMGKADAG